MIVYDLHCPQQHRFEGWFASADDFTRQRERSLVRCPLCDDAAIERRPSAHVHMARGQSSGAASIAPAATRSAAGASANHPAMGGDSQLLTMLRKAVAQSEDVGAKFPEEARKIHYEETAPRTIRGQASPEEAKSLRDEGIEFLSLPDVVTRELN